MYKESTRISRVVKFSIYIFSSIYISLAILLSFILIHWWAIFLLPKHLIEGLIPTDDKYVTYFKILMFTIITILYFTIGLIALAGTVQEETLLLRWAFMLVVFKYALQFVLLFEIVFLDGFHENIHKDDVRTASNFFLAFTIYPLLTDLLLMANVADLRRQITIVQINRKKRSNRSGGSSSSKSASDKSARSLFNIEKCGNQDIAVRKSNSNSQTNLNRASQLNKEKSKSILKLFAMKTSSLSTVDEDVSSTANSDTSSEGANPVSMP